MATHILERYLTRFVFVVETVIDADGVRETAIVLDDGNERADVLVFIRLPGRNER